jgi:hypothetical protein
MDKDGFSQAIRLLETNVSRNIATLKYLTQYREHAVVKIAGDKAGWAILSSFPTSVLSYDRVVYPQAKVAVFVNGTSENLIYELLNKLPLEQYVFRLNAPLDLAPLESRYNITRGYIYNSYTGDTLPQPAPTVTVPSQSELTEEAICLFGLNNHDREDLVKHFSHGARWFGYIEDNRIKSLCFTYDDYGDYREIGGVRTVDGERRKGYAHIVVYSALKYLLDNHFKPRYVTEEANTNSNALAQNLGMKRFLKLEHFLLSPR